MRLDHPEVRRARRRELWAELVAAGIVITAMLVGASALRGCGTAIAQVDDDAAVMLARTCVSERGWAVDSHDCAAIAEVVRGRIERTGESWVEALGELSPRLHGDAPITRPWLRGLIDERRPDGWRLARWDSHRDAWLATLEEARELIAQERRVCSSPPVSWGSSDDVRRRARRGARWHEVDCGPTLNRFGWWSR